MQIDYGSLEDLRSWGNPLPMMMEVLAACADEETEVPEADPETLAQLGLLSGVA